MLCDTVIPSRIFYRAGGVTAIFPSGRVKQWQHHRQLVVHCRPLLSTIIVSMDVDASGDPSSASQSPTVDNAASNSTGGVGSRVTVEGAPPRRGRNPYARAYNTTVTATSRSPSPKRQRRYGTRSTRSSSSGTDARANTDANNFYNINNDDEAERAFTSFPPVAAYYRDTPVVEDTIPPAYGISGTGSTGGAVDDDVASYFPATPIVHDTIPTIDQSAAPTLHSIYDHATGSETFPIEVPAAWRSAIIAVLSLVWKVLEPRLFQIYVLYYMVFLSKQLIYLIRKTGEGKSMIILGAATMRRGVTVVLVPLIGLGSDPNFSQ